MPIRSAEWWAKHMPEGGFDFRVPALHNGQKQVLREQREINWLCAGRGWRKSSLLLHIMKHYALRRQEPVMWTSFTWDPITTVQTDHMQKMFGDMWDDMYDATDHILQPPGWQPVYFASLQAAPNQRGKTPGVIINDEAGQLPDGIYTSILRPMIFKSKGAYWAAGTPNPADPNNDLWRFASKHTALDHVQGWVIPVLGAEYYNRDIVRKPHPYENNHFTFNDLYKAWLECQTENDRIKFRIEYLCEFLRDAGSQIEDPRKACVVEYVDGQASNEWIAKGHRPSKSGYYQKGADLAVSRDFLAIGVMDLETNKQVYMRHFIPTAHDKDGKWEQLYAALKRCDDMFPGKFIVDTTGMGDSLPGTMKRRFSVLIEGVSFAGGNALKVAYHDNLATLLEGFRVALFKHEALMKELEGLKRNAEGSIIKIGNDVGKKGTRTAAHDDLATMAALMCRGMDGGEIIMNEPDIPLVRQIWIPQTEVNPFSQVGEVW